MPILKKAILILVALGVVGIVALELSLRFFAPQPLNPEAKLIFSQDIEGIQPEVVYQLNELYLRTLNWDSLRKKPGSKRILFVGGSSTDCVIHNAEDTWWGQTWLRVQEATPYDVECAALAAYDDSILYAAKWCEAYLKDLEVDLMVINFGFGEIIRDGVQYRYDPNKMLKIELDERSEWRIALNKHLHLYRLLRVWRHRGLNNARQRMMGRHNYFKDLLQERRDLYARLPYIEGIMRDVANDPLLEYLDGVDRFVEFSKQYDVPLLVLGEPVLHDDFLGPEQILLLRVPVVGGSGPQGGLTSQPGLGEPGVAAILRGGHEAVRRGEHTLCFVELESYEKREELSR